jgi:sarcosine oxidase subunit alpha
MSTRLSTGGRIIDRSKACFFTFNGKRMKGYAGDTLAAALLANDQMLMGRSFKYHRPRGAVAYGVEEPNALMNVGEGGRFEPNQRATVTEVFDGLQVRSQNHWPSLEYDIGGLNRLVARFLPAGFYYKTFLWPRPFWKHVFEPFIRQSAGLGAAPKDRDADTYEHLYAFCDVLVVGGGISGLRAALEAGRSGKRVILIEQGPVWGGRAVVDGRQVDGLAADDWVKNALQDIDRMDNVIQRTRCTGAGVYDHGYVLASERLHDHAPVQDVPRHRLWRIRAGHVVIATGALERPLSFAGNDVPGVMLASAVRDYVVNHGVSVGDRTVIVTNNDDAYLTARVLIGSGLSVPCIVDARPDPDSDIVRYIKSLGVEVKVGMAIADVIGRGRVTGVTLCKQAGEGTVLETIACEAVAMSGGWSPVVHLWSHCGGKLLWDEAAAMFRPDPDHPPTDQNGAALVTAVGRAYGEIDQGILAPVWIMPHGASIASRNRMWLDFQNDVKVSDLQLAAREGFESVEHAKRYTTLGMATDQGKLSNINGLAVLADALDHGIPQVGTTTFRPPYTPVTLGAIAGEARAEVFQPLRRTPLHDWHADHGARWEPAGQWRRPYCYQTGAETPEQAVHREVRATRSSLGLLDASTLGKIIVKGPDAGRFLDMIYTNMMSTLGVGKCRYGLMCSENGFLIDDGVVARLDADTFLCHTTTGGADRIHSWMEDWLQCEWWDWKVWTVNVTEQSAQIAVVGPMARRLLQKLGGMDVSAAALPFMTWGEGRLDHFNVRIYRISFSGELSFEISVSAGEALALWQALMEAGAEFGVTPYGTEALHVMRAEKGFIMIGDETDGTTIPQDLGLDWAISARKADYLGKRAHARSHMTDPDRWKLVGLETLDGSVLPDGAYCVEDGENANGQRLTIGRVTSSYQSPTLGRGIAMGLVRNGPALTGEILRFPTLDGAVIKARVVSPVFYDPDGEKQNV